MKKYIIPFTFALLAMLQWSCEDMLDVDPPSELKEEDVLTDNGIRSLLFSAYREVQVSTPSRWLIQIGEVTTDVAYNTDGGENLQMAQLINFTWDPTLATLQDDNWAPFYRSIRNVNLLLDLLPRSQSSEANKALFAAEGHMLRGYAFAHLYSLFGSVPLRNWRPAPGESVQLARASDEEIQSFIEAELLAAIPDLPDPGKEQAFGRANKGMAWAILAKFYLNTRQWQKAADAAQEVIGFGYYDLFDDFETMFRVENEGNREMIMVIPCLNVDGYGNWWQAGAMPNNFRSSPDNPYWVWKNTMAIFATQYRLRSAFVNTFDFAKDVRARLILRSFVNADGATVNLAAQTDNCRSLKYFDPATVGNNSGNDVPVIRYADILLTRAEAMNELDGPSQDALDLINEVRTRAGLDDITLAEAVDKETLRNFILRERGWEFVSEAKRREDLLRHDKFILSAQGRGAAATDKHKLFPFPQSERDSNPISGQNPGYEVTQ
ncbi:RagB/SusD family nutrient uptake outer membrane protein [Fulvivirgaceae bacterium PWU5]|uniref:RagB/SusD family nutrient uptake outer membrane protein n=1 Tax=Dawidia cretensis TaxID=2782350 RepID=A0AAP2GVR2_9BACT|nr:RagB/SusD family nutrient uptake outer membrane protein [Dawidia cretensis]MBT1710970.1 RagB/SusD family nutrient uptake outer membrane protein [Dawidia cretensis]